MIIIDEASPMPSFDWSETESCWNPSIVRYWHRRQITKERIARQHADNRAVRRAVRRAAGSLEELLPPRWSDGMRREIVIEPPRHGRFNCAGDYRYD